MSEIPRAVLSEHFEERMQGRRLHTAVFTTYKFDPGFFEREILPVFLDIQLSHVPSLRLVQLERVLPELPGGIAVYYDSDGLISKESARLDYRRIPIRQLQWRRRQGVFHAKCLFLLLEDREADETGRRRRSLVIATSSANLTESGWWSNVEACHVEEIGENDATRMKDDLTWFLRWLRDHTFAESGGKPEESARKPVQNILDFLGKTEQRSFRSGGASLHTHFYAGRQSMPDFLNEIAKDRIVERYLEVISPYFDKAESCQPLLELIERFGPKEVRVFLPRSRSGDGLLNQEIYDSVRQLPIASWARLPSDILSSGKSEDAGDRFVHAKIYRFFTQNPKSEIIFVGSPNLTRPAHQLGGNIETGFLVEVVPERRPDWWLISDARRPDAFEPRSETDDEGSGLSGTKLQLRYRWDTKVAEAFWEDNSESPPLRLEARSILLGEVKPLEANTWIILPEDIRSRISSILTETAFVTVYEGASEPHLLLVQEEGMEHKPSLLLKLSVADILRYWSLLTPEQKAAFIETRGQELAATSEGSDLIAIAKREAEQETFFDRFAGFFHAFACLERSIREALKNDNNREACYRLFGCKYDSLGTLLKKLFEGSGDQDDVERYLILMCAQQLWQEIRKDFPEFYKEHAGEFKSLEKAIAQGNEIRERLTAKAPDRMPSFLDWFDHWFLKRAKPEEKSVD